MIFSLHLLFSHSRRMNSRIWDIFFSSSSFLWFFGLVIREHKRIPNKWTKSTAANIHDVVHTLLIVQSTDTPQHCCEVIRRPWCGLLILCRLCDGFAMIHNGCVRYSHSRTHTHTHSPEREHVYLCWVSDFRQFVVAGLAFGANYIIRFAPKGRWNDRSRHRCHSNSWTSN